VQIPVTDLSAECAQCGASLTPEQQQEGGFCSPACRRAFLADAEAWLDDLLQSMLTDQEPTPGRKELSQ
jgi:endogenous inhibitor of DNA gyrase (YacG/DUF329 family)